MLVNVGQKNPSVNKKKVLSDVDPKNFDRCRSKNLFDIDQKIISTDIVKKNPN